jgi:succinoglycan biosynthesis protein ExoO
LSQLLDLAGECEADILADDLTYFVENREPHGRLLAGLQLARPTIIPPETLITGRSARGVAVAFGYLKPLFRRELTNAVRYDETLRIGEDFDLLLRMVLNGARLCVTPQSFYRYRRHASSISHRLSSATAQAMLHSHERLMQDYKDASPSIGAAFQRHHRALSEQLAYELLVEAIKRRQFGPACRALLRQPALVTRLLRSMRERWSRAAPRREQVSS